MVMHPNQTPTASILPAVNTKTSHIPSLLNMNIENPNKETPCNEDTNETTATLDAAKKKVLPAWIR